MRSAIAALALATVVAGCGSAGHAGSVATDCKTLVQVTNIVGPATTDMSGVPLSNADARVRIARASKAVRAALRRVRTTNGNGTVETARKRLLVALRLFSGEIAVAASDLRTGKTQQQKSQGFVDASLGVEKVNAAQTSVLAACPKSG
jgi:hypothetical protein